MHGLILKYTSELASEVILQNRTALMCILDTVLRHFGCIVFSRRRFDLGLRAGMEGVGLPDVDGNRIPAAHPAVLPFSWSLDRLRSYTNFFRCTRAWTACTRFPACWAPATLTP